MVQYQGLPLALKGTHPFIEVPEEATRAVASDTDMWSSGLHHLESVDITETPNSRATIDNSYSICNQDHGISRR